jgi:F0F1-type ATP synthase assembly protein I
MGGQQSTTVAIDAFTKSTNNLMMESINKFASTSNTSINQEVNVGGINLKGNSKLKGFTVDMDASVNLSTIANQAVNMDMRQEMKDNFVQQLNNAHTQFPGFNIGVSDTNVQTKIQNLFETNVDEKFSTENILAQSVDINQKLNVDGIRMQDNAELEDAKFSFTADVVQQMVSGVSSEIKNELIKQTESTSSAENVNRDPLSAGIESVGGAISGIVGTTLGGIAGIFSASPLAMVIVLIIVCVGGYFGYKKYMGGGNSDSSDSFFTAVGSLVVDGGDNGGSNNHNSVGGGCDCLGGAEKSLFEGNEFIN